MKHKAEIISQVLHDLPDGLDGGVACSEAYKAHVIKSLQESLPDGYIQTCEDIKEMRVDCCRGCHNFDSDQLFLETFPGGQVAWICCAVRRALFPEEAAANGIDSEPLVSATWPKPSF